MTETLKNLTIHPEPGQRALSSDLLSHVLSQIRLTGDQVFSRTLGRDETLDLESSDGHILVVTEGTLHIDGGETPHVAVNAGDLVLLTRGAQDLRIKSARAAAKIVICRFWFDAESLRGLVFALPPFIHIEKDAGHGWIDGIVHFMTIEANDVQPGAALMISRLIDLAVIRTLRTWVHQGNISGWLGGLADPRIARSLKSIHDKPMARLDIKTLADIAGMSRSSFCALFTTLVGRAPLRYQTELRLGLARNMLCARDARVGEIGLRIGYESEAAFSRAYKAFYGYSPRDEHARQTVEAKTHVFS